MREIELVIVHAADTTPTMDIGVATIDRWHKERGFLWSRTLKYGSVGDHAVTRREGALEQGRPDEVVGAHAVPFNHHSLGVRLAGGLTPTTSDARRTSPNSNTTA